MSPSVRMRPASLRGRVVLGVLALLAVLLVALFVSVDLVLGARLRSDLRTRLTDRAALARQLDGALSSQQLVDRLRGDGVAALLCSRNTTSQRTSSSSTADDNGLRCVQADSADVPATPARPSTAPQVRGRPGRPGGSAPAPPAAGGATTVQASGPVLYLRTTLPSSRQVLTLSVDSSQVGQTVRGLIVLEVVGGLIALVLAAAVAFRVVGVALRPLDRMTTLARSIAAGDRGRRLRVARADTELGRTGAAFDDMLDELESALSAAALAQQRLRALLSDVSHELRTPLTGLLATTETLLRDEPDERVARERLYVSLVRETRRADRLVDDLLTVTRLDTGLTLDVADVDLVEIAAHELDRLRVLAPELIVRAGGVASAPARADATRVGQVIANVLANARTAAGPHAAITLDITRSGANWQLDIRDDGPGVPAAEAERVFERLVRLDTSRARDSGGFGLGLAIARALARAHGGDLVCVPDPPGGGALFRLTLPADGASG